MTTTDLSLSLIRTDGGTQMRVEISEDVYTDYRDKWKSGEEFDPIDVFYDGTTYWLADGFHRFYGAREAKMETIPAKVHKGTRRDAILFACGANARHGLRRTNPDKRKAVLALLDDEEWVGWTDNAIAEKALVDQSTVSKIRSELMESINSLAAKTADQPKKGRDGKMYPPKPPKKKPTPEASPKQQVSDFFEGKESTREKAEEKQPKQKVMRADADMPESYVDDNGDEVPRSLWGVWRQKTALYQIRNDLQVVHGKLAKYNESEASCSFSVAAEDLVHDAIGKAGDAIPSVVDDDSWLAAGECEDG